MTPHESWLLTPWTNPLMCAVAVSLAWRLGATRFLVSIAIVSVAALFALSLGEVLR